MLIRDGLLDDTSIPVANIAPVTNTFVTKEQQAIIDKAYEAGQMMFSERGIQSPRQMMHRLDTLFAGNMLSEETVKRFDYQFSQANVNQISPLIGNATLSTLGMVIQEVGSSVETTNILSLAMPDKAVPSYNVLLDRIAPNTGMAPEYGGDNATIPTIAQLQTYILSYKSALWLGRTSIQAFDIINQRRLGESGFDQRGYAQLIAYNTINQITQMMTRKKYMLSQALFNNGFSYGGATISSNIPSANYISIGGAIGSLNTNGSVDYNTASGYSPMNAITSIVQNPLLYKYRDYIKGFIANSADVQAIMQHPAVQSVTNYLAMGSLSNNTVKVVANGMEKELTAYYMPTMQNIPFLCDNQVYQNQNADGTAQTTPNDATSANSAQQFFVPRGKMYILMDLSSLGGVSGAFHLTYNPADPNVSSPAMGLYTGVFQRNLHNSDNTINRIDLVTGLSGNPAVYMPEAQFFLTGLYSNVS